MNITDIDHTCQKESRKCFEAFKDSVLNHPFISTSVNPNIINDSIEFQINQKFGAKIFDKYISEAKTNAQIKYIENKITKYKAQLLSVALCWSDKVFLKID